MSWVDGRRLLRGRMSQAFTVKEIGLGAYTDFCDAMAHVDREYRSLIDALAAMNDLAKGPAGGVTQAQKREVIANADAAIAKATGEPQ